MFWLFVAVVVVVVVIFFRGNWDAKNWTSCMDTFCPVSRSPEPAFEVHEKKVRFVEGLIGKESGRSKTCHYIYIYC